MTGLKRASDALLLLAIVVLVVAVFGPVWLYGIAGLCLVASVVLTVVRRRRQAARKAAREAGQT